MTEERNKADAAMLEPPEENDAKPASSTVKEDIPMKESEETKETKEQKEEKEAPTEKTAKTDESTNDAAMPPPEDKDAKPTPSPLKEDSPIKNKKAPEETNVEKEKDAPTKPELPPRPIKKARTAYFIFADEKRAEITARVSLYEYP